MPVSRIFKVQSLFSLDVFSKSEYAKNFQSINDIFIHLILNLGDADSDST